MRTVALISQPLRAAHCHAFLQAEEGNHLVVTTDPGAFTTLDFGATTQVSRIAPPPEILPTAKLSRSLWFRRTLSRARSGSRLGAWFERTAKRIVWRLRYLDRLTLALRKKEPPEIELSTLRQSMLFKQIEEEHSIKPFSQVVVFDLFDLPIGLEFAREHEIEVLVR